jgi:hypothetical protein
MIRQTTLASSLVRQTPRALCPHDWNFMEALPEIWGTGKIAKDSDAATAFRFCFYEYARESEFLRCWAKSADENEFSVGRQSEPSVTTF